MSISSENMQTTVVPVVEGTVVLVVEGARVGLGLAEKDFLADAQGHVSLLALGELEQSVVARLSLLLHEPELHAHLLQLLSDCSCLVRDARIHLLLHLRGQVLVVARQPVEQRPLGA